MDKSRKKKIKRKVSSRNRTRIAERETRRKRHDFQQLFQQKNAE